MSNMGNGYEKGKPDVSYWIRELSRGIRFRRDYALEAKWPTWRNYYRGRWNRDVLPVNLFFRMIRTIVPRVYFRNPSISITSTMPGEENQMLSHILERVDNKLIRTMKVKNQIKKAIQDAFMFGTGVCKLGYGAQFTFTPEEGSTVNPVSKKNEVFEYSSIVQDNMPWFMRTPTGNFIVPDGLVEYEDARWSATWIRRDPWDVQNDPRLKHSKELKGTGTDTTQMSGLPAKKPDKIGSVDLVEIRDRKFKTVFVLAPYESDKVLYYDEDEMQINGHMTNYPLIFNGDDEVFWGVPDSIILEPQQIELNEVRTLQMKHRRISLVKLLYRNKAITEEQLAKLIDYTVGAAIGIDGDPMTDVRPLQVGDIPKDLFMAGNEIMNDVRENMGFSRNQSGNYAEGSADRTATEARIIEMATEIRVDERKDMVADMLEDIVVDMHNIIFERWSGEQVIDIAGPDGLPVWVAYTPDMLKAGRYKVNVDPDSAVPETAELRLARGFKVYEILKMNPLIDPVKLTKYLLHELPGTAYDNLMRDSVLQGGGAQGTNPQNPLTPQQYMDTMGKARQNTGGGAK